MLNLQIDPHSGVPVYRQIMDQIKYCGASGLLKPNSQLPSIRELALALSINPTTVVKAYSELEHEGVIEMRHGKGAFLADAPRMSDGQRKQALRRIARQAGCRGGADGCADGTGGPRRHRRGRGRAGWRGWRVTGNGSNGKRRDAGRGSNGKRRDAGDG